MVLWGDGMNDLAFLTAVELIALYRAHKLSPVEVTEATLAAIATKLKEMPGARIVGFNYDTGERSLSVPEFLPGG